MKIEKINVESSGALGRLTLNRPERLNAVNATMLRELVEAARWFDEQRDRRAPQAGDRYSNERGRWIFHRPCRGPRWLDAEHSLPQMELGFREVPLAAERRYRLSALFAVDNPLSPVS
jgi:hypothetical protein